MKPITPKEVEEIKIKDIPDFVIDLLNKEIVKNWDGNKAIVFKKNIDAQLSKERLAIDFCCLKSIFNRAGWSVYLEAPSYGERFEPYYLFQTDI